MFSAKDCMAPRSSEGSASSSGISGEICGNRLCRASMAEDDDVAVSTFWIEFDDRRLHNADGLDRCAKQRVGLGRRFRLARPVRIVLQAARIGCNQLHGNNLLSFGRTDCPCLLIFFSKTPPEPQDGPAAAIAPEQTWLAGERALVTSALSLLAASLPIA